ncbi:putative acyltransferase [Frankia casuarinae]|uniref:acyltransferase family protein n=1 Tax=Frankia TaxID=1854 RepID=UPI000053BADD|nr:MULTISPECIES: acyltransferase family protein [Frankia]ETA00895.1 putative acyltransferase [Frankia sp. CcI6]EYT91317.1 putative acyltransferase [Frankia casuarinae]KDA40699.1 putative acyltransferase [Frankia sp. BMG5.23]OHV51977.1 acyltransferase [Frankia sp. CgIS1]ORT51280.1 acyltransferase [Frankia sp. KB5]
MPVVCPGEVAADATPGDEEGTRLTSNDADTFPLASGGRHRRVAPGPEPTDTVPINTRLGGTRPAPGATRPPAGPPYRSPGTVTAPGARARAGTRPRTGTREATGPLRVEEDLDATGPVLAPLGHSPALDGLRALAVTAVIAYHAGVSWMPGGLLGVDTFFVLSGFLITGLLIAEYRYNRRIDLRAFWIRRSRRLMPALLLLLLGVAAYARWIASPGDVGTLRLDALSTLLYVANWRFALSDQSYFDHFSAPSPLLHTWSLSVEEQFYVLWPLIVYLLMRHSAKTVDRWRRQRQKAQSLALTVAVLGAEASALVGLALLVVGTNPSRIYYGTDSRAQALLVGAALAVWRAQRTTPISARARSVMSVVGCVATAAMILLWTTVGGESRGLYAGGFLGVAIIVMLLVASLVEAPRGPVARVLATAPLTFVGRISYGLYLWHWPIFLTLTATRTGTNGVVLLGLRLAATLAITLASFHLVENPIRRGKVRFPVPRVTVPAALGGVLAVILLATAGTSASVRTPADLEALARRAATSPQPAVAVKAGGNPPIKVLLGGDSVALTLGFSDFSSMAAQQGMEIHDFSKLGCGVARGMQRRILGSAGPTTDGCDQWPQRFAQRVNEVNPALAILLVGRWEVTDQMRDGRWTHIGDPGFDAYLGRELDLAIDTLGAKGAKVVLLTTPVFKPTEAPNGGIYPETKAERVVRFNALLRAAAARHPGVTVIDITSILTPGDKYVDELDGVRLRDDDGVHISNGGARRIGVAIIPQLLRIARGAAAAAPAPTTPTTGAGPG